MDDSQQPVGRGRRGKGRVQEFDQPRCASEVMHSMCLPRALNEQ
jgi:hypothetical protein